MRCYIREVDNQTNKDVTFETTVGGFAGKPYTVKAGESWRSQSSTVGLIAIPDTSDKFSSWKFDVSHDDKNPRIHIPARRGHYHMQIDEMRATWIPDGDPFVQSDTSNPKLSSEQHIKITLTGDPQKANGVNFSYCIVD